MCLIRRLDEPLLEAEEDIVCYKAVQIPYKNWFKLKTLILRFFNLEKHYQTYYTEEPIIIGNEVTAFPEHSFYDLGIIARNCVNIEGGFIHSFALKEDAVVFAQSRSHMDVVKCVIPKGAYYFEGYNSLDNTPGFASTKIKYVKVV